MESSEETRRVVEAYFSAWTSGRVDDAYALLADDLHFAGPTAHYEKAEDFRIPLQRFAAMTISAKIEEFIVEGGRAALLYDCELPQPVGKIKISSFFRVKEGKIYWYETQFDARGFDKLQPSSKS